MARNCNAILQLSQEPWIQAVSPTIGIAGLFRYLLPYLTSLNSPQAYVSSRA